MSASEREAVEARFTYWRVLELERDPVRGAFDVAHLQEINRRIFQDLPGAGFADVTPGQYRPPVSEGKDWMKQRGLSTLDGAFFVAYSPMNAAAIAAMEQALGAARPATLRGLDTATFTARIAQLYTALDYAHPFRDGNSRSLRTFTRQLARESGGVLDWARFNCSPADRDALYIARDISVNQFAKPHIQQEQTMRRVVGSLTRLQGYMDLPALLAS